MTLAAVYVVLTTLYNLRHMLRLPTSVPLPCPLPLISVLIPARNEEHNIGACLESLLGQDYAHLEILVLDDESSDATQRIMRGFAEHNEHVRLIHGSPLPPGWHGKTWACHQLSLAARGEWLLFTDADTRHGPGSVSAALAAAQARQLDLLSLIPDMAPRGFGERVLMSVIPFVFVACVPHIAFTRTRLPILAAAIGPFMMFRKETYLRMGGHESVKSDIAEDVFLARRVKQVGGRIALADGISTLRVEFYRSFHEAWHGMSKSAFAVFDYSLSRILLALTACFIACVGPYLFVYYSYTHGLTDMAHFSLPLTQILLTWVAMWLVDRRFRIPARYSMLIGFSIFVAITMCIRSVHQTVLGPGTSWKGRTYQFGPGRAKAVSGTDRE
jgi:chlorobactene glucosyltransferase